MKTNVAVLLVGAVAGQMLLLGSGCKDPDVLAPRGYQIPQAEADPEVNYQSAAVTRPKTPPVPTPEIKTEEETFYKPQPVESRRPARAVESTPTQYTVKKNDTLGSIGQRHGVSAAALAQYNNLDIKKYIHIGQVIMIPPPGTVIQVERTKASPRSNASRQGAAKPSAAAATTSAAAANSGLTDGYYLVRRGDSISRIAAHFKVKRADLMKANSINENTILHIGQKLVIPGKSPASTAAVAPRSPASAAPVSAAPTAAQSGSAAPPLPPGKDVDGILDGIEDPTTAAPAAVPGASAVTPSAQTPPATPVTATSLTNRKSIDIPVDTTWEQLAVMYGTTADELKRLNPDVRDDKTVRAGRILFIP